MKILAVVEKEALNTGHSRAKILVESVQNGDFSDVSQKESGKWFEMMIRPGGFLKNESF